MTINAFLAQYATAENGKLSAIGFPIDVIPVGMGFGLVVIGRIPWDETNEGHEVIAELVDADGQAVSIAPLGAVVVHMPMGVGRPFGAPKGIAFNYPVATMFPPLMPLHAGRYEFHFTVDGRLSPDAVPFEIRGQLVLPSAPAT